MFAVVLFLIIGYEFTNFIAMTCTIILSYFVISYFHIFLLWVIDLRLGHSHCNKWYTISLASMSTNQEAIRSSHPRPSPPRFAQCPNPENNGTMHTVPLPLLRYYITHLNRQRLSTYDRQAFAIPVPSVWNSLPHPVCDRNPNVTEAAFRHLSKTCKKSRHSRTDATTKVQWRWST